MENTEERNVYERKYYIFFVYKPFFGNYTVYTALMDTLSPLALTEDKSGGKFWRIYLF